MSLQNSENNTSEENSSCFAQLGASAPKKNPRKRIDSMESHDKIMANLISKRL
jgi:hypothetical protein